MITAQEAKTGTNPERYNKFVNELEARIRKAMEEGRRDCYFGGSDDDMTDIEYTAKREFLSRGFSFRPTGYMNGVWQLSQQICW